MIAFVYLKADIDKIPGVEFILVGPNDDSVVEEALEQARIVFLVLLFNPNNAQRIIDIQDCVLNTVDMSEDLPLDKFLYMIEQDQNNSYFDEQIAAVQSSLITYVEDADLKQQRLSQANYLAELETFISGEIATITSYQHTIIL